MDNGVSSLTANLRPESATTSINGNSPNRAPLATLPKIIGWRLIRNDSDSPSKSLWSERDKEKMHLFNF